MRSDEEGTWSELFKALGLVGISLALYIPKLVWGLVGMATGKYACIQIGPVAVRCLTEEEMKAVDEQDWIEHGGREFEDTVIDDILQQEGRYYSGRLHRLMRPSSN